ncbi:hypothetical protein [Arcanobacterium hippocoleae]|uniref:hypothetical protein n=1 Tax=Arcanobacterium hippocoleae TaxID=149017 RepID=UPI00333E93A2
MKIEITDHFPLTRVQLCAILASRELIDARIQALQQIKKIALPQLPSDASSHRIVMQTAISAKPSLH